MCAIDCVPAVPATPAEPRSPEPVNQDFHFASIGIHKQVRLLSNLLLTQSKSELCRNDVFQVPRRQTIRKMRQRLLQQSVVSFIPMVVLRRPHARPHPPRHHRRHHPRHPLRSYLLPRKIMARIGMACTGHLLALLPPRHQPQHQPRPKPHRPRNDGKVPPPQ